MDGTAGPSKYSGANRRHSILMPWGFFPAQIRLRTNLDLTGRAAVIGISENAVKALGLDQPTVDKEAYRKALLSMRTPTIATREGKQADELLDRSVILARAAAAGQVTIPDDLIDRLSFSFQRYKQLETIEVIWLAAYIEALPLNPRGSFIGDLMRVTEQVAGSFDMKYCVAGKVMAELFAQDPKATDLMRSDRKLSFVNRMKEYEGNKYASLYAAQHMGQFVGELLPAEGYRLPVLMSMGEELFPAGGEPRLIYVNYLLAAQTNRFSPEQIGEWAIEAALALTTSAPVGQKGLLIAKQLGTYKELSEDRFVSLLVAAYRKYTQGKEPLMADDLRIFGAAIRGRYYHWERNEMDTVGYRFCHQIELPLDRTSEFFGYMVSIRRA